MRRRLFLWLLPAIAALFQRAAAQISGFPPGAFDNAAARAPAPPVIVVSTPDLQIAGNLCFYTGNYSGYTGGPPAALDYQFDSAGWNAASSPQISGGYFGFYATAPTTGTHTISVRDHGSTGVFGTSNNFPTYTATIVHLHNAPAWSAATFTDGQRITNTSKAYQVVNPGTSTAAPTGTGTSINNGGIAAFKYLSGVSFTSTTACAAHYAGATLANPTAIYLWNDQPGTAWNTYGSLSNLTPVSSSTNSLIVKCASGESFADGFGRGAHKVGLTNPSYGVVLGSTISVNPSFVVTTDYLKAFNGLQVHNYMVNQEGAPGLVLGFNTGHVSQCIMQDDGLHDSGPFSLGLSSGTTKSNITVTNNITVSYTPPDNYSANYGTRGMIMSNVGSLSVFANNSCIVPLDFSTKPIVNPTGQTFLFGGPFNSNNFTIRNCAFFGQPLNDLQYPPYAGSMDCVADGHNGTDGLGLSPLGGCTGGTVGSVLSIPFSLGTFVQPNATVVSKGLNLRPTAGSALIGAGSASVPITTDILGYSRGTSFDIGAVQST